MTHPADDVGVSAELSRMRDCEAQLEVLTAVGEAFRRSSNESEVINNALARLGRYLGASRCLYATLEGAVHNILYEYLSTGRSLLGVYNHSERDLRATAGTVSSARTVVINDVEELSSEEAALWKALEVRALVFCPLLIGGVRRATIVVHKDCPRIWTEREVLLIEEVVSRCWVFLEQRVNQARLVETESLLRIASRLAKVGGWVMELPSQQVRWAGEAEELFGYEPGALEGRDWATENVPEEYQQTLAAAMQRCVEHGESYDITFPIYVPGGTTWVRCVAEAERGDDGIVRRVLGAYQNVEEQRRLEEQGLQTQRLEAVGHLAGGIAHDFNNLLSVILGYTALLLESDEIGEAAREDLKEIHQAGERASHLTRQLLAFSRRQLLELTVIDVGQLLTDMQVLLRRLLGETLELSLEVSPNTRLVLADRGQLEQVVMNLAVNARDAMESGGILTIGCSTQTITSPPPDLPEMTPGEYTVLFVQDTGKGVDEGIKARIFEPFFTTKAVGKGTGLGLSTVLGIVKQTHGHVRVLSEPGRGARFEVFLTPTEPAAPPLASQAETPAKSDLAPTILLVEDEPSVRRVVSESLQRAGFRVLESDSGTHALSLFESNPGPIDLVLTDVIMPGLTGPQLVVRLRDLQPDVNVLYLSGYLGDELPPAVAAEQILIKPVRPTDLVEAVRRKLSTRK